MVTSENGIIHTYICTIIHTSNYICCVPISFWKTLFLDLVTFLLDLDTFHGPYYNSFGDGYPSFGPAHPPAGPHPSLLLDLALSQTIPFSDRFYSFCPAASASQFFRQ